jgi:membrane protein YdbS with pleckstrin-like domain
VAAPTDIARGHDAAVAFRTGEYRPHPNLLKLYALTSLALGPFFFLLLVPRLFRYHTLRYAFDAEGVSMRWGVLFRKEVSLTYARIQDIHLVSNVIERWLGLGRVQVQTASGSAGAEMTIEGLTQFEAVRDFLYTRMRGARGEPAAADAGFDGAADGHGSGDAVVDALRETAAALRALRETLAARAGGPPP